MLNDLTIDQTITLLINNLIKTINNSDDNMKLDHICNQVFKDHSRKEGSGRYVVIIDNEFVVKFAINLNGVYQNKTEVETKPKSKLAPILKSISLFGFDNFAIVQSYFQPLDDYYNNLIDSIDPYFEYDETLVSDIFTKENIKNASYSKLDDILIEFTTDFIESSLDADATFDDFWSKLSLRPLASDILDDLGTTPDNNIENIAISDDNEFILIDYGIQSHKQLSDVINNRNNQMTSFSLEKLKKHSPDKQGQLIIWK